MCTLLKRTSCRGGSCCRRIGVHRNRCLLGRRSLPTIQRITAVACPCCLLLCCRRLLHDCRLLFCCRRLFCYVRLFLNCYLLLLTSKRLLHFHTNCSLRLCFFRICSVLRLR